MRVQTLPIMMLSLLLFSSPSLLAQNNNLALESNNVGEVRYVIDDLYTYMHSGPGKNYRIIGSIGAGAKIQQLSIDNDANYIEVIDDKNRRGWVDARHISATESIRERLPIIEQQLAFSGEQVADKQKEIEFLQEQLTQLSDERVALQEQLKNVEDQFNDAQNSLANRTMEEQKQWFIIGGSFGIGCILIGVILSQILKRKRREDTWM